jgi:ankyrin repeat protein
MKINLFISIVLSLCLFSKVYPISISQQHKFGKELVSKAQRGNFDLIKNYAAKGADLNYQDSEGKNILMYAAENERFDIIDLLRNKNVDPNLVDNQSFTALMLAASKGNVNSVKELLKYKDININKQGKHGKTALDWAYNPKHLYAEQIQELTDISKIPKENQNIITLLKKFKAKTGNQVNQKNNKTY